MIFGIALLPVLGLTGAAIDYSRAASANSRLQAAVDSATITLSKMPLSTSQSDLETRANTLVRALLADPTVSSTISVSVTPTSSTVALSAIGQVQTQFLSALGTATAPLQVQATALRGNTRLRLALVLDVTGSMNSSNKLTALKTASSNLIDQMQGASAHAGDVYISIVPFAKDVNVGSSNYSQSWVKFSGASDTWDENNGTCNKSGYTNKSSCQSQNICTNSSFTTQTSCTAGAACSRRSYTTQSSCTQAGGTWTTGTPGTWVAATWTPANHSTWNGCVMDRDQNYDTTNTAPGAANATSFPAEQYAYCPPQLMALSYDWTALKAKINGLTAAGGTNQQIGLAWGYQTLTASPFSIPTMDPNYNYIQAVILLSDGLNTQNRFYGDGYNYSSQVDDRQKILCDNVKAAGITIYTVQVNTSGDPTSSVLQYCASGTDKFFQLTSSDEIVGTFSQIGAALTQLRLTH